MKVAVDSWTLASRFRHHGTYVYAMNLMQQFRNFSSQDERLRFCLFASGRAANDAASIDPCQGFEITPTRLLDRDRVWRLGGAGFAAVQAGADLVFCPTTSVLPLGPVPMVCTVHDLSALTMPSHSPRVNRLLRWLLWWTAKLARAIITVSHRSKADLVRVYGLDPSRVHVVYNGCDHAIFNDKAPDSGSLQQMKTRLGLERPYILHHGTIQPRKNLRRLIAGYRLLLTRNRSLDLDLVLAGNCGWEYQDILADAKRAGVGKIALSGPLSSTDLALLIKGAELSVMPSLYEGFCMPMLESMACGTPTIAAGTSCLPEISGGALLYFDPESVEEMACCMEQVLTSQKLRSELSERGRARAREFSWERCAKETVQALVEAAGK